MAASPTFASAPRSEPSRLVDHDRLQTKFECVGTHTPPVTVWALNAAGAAAVYLRAFRPAAGSLVLAREVARPDRAAAFRVAGPRELLAE